jgi:hypothetical protein
LKIRNTFWLALLVSCFDATNACGKGHGEIIGHARALWCGGPFVPEIGACYVYSIPVVVSVYTQDGLVGEVTSDAVGKFTISNLKPGNYVLVASAALPPPVYFLRYFAAMQTVTLENKDSVSIDLFLDVIP